MREIVTKWGLLMAVTGAPPASAGTSYGQLATGSSAPVFALKEN